MLKKKPLTYEAQLDQAHSDVDKSLTAFKKAAEELHLANANLDKLVNEIDMDMSRLAALREQAENKKASNTSVIGKLTDLVEG